MSIEVWPGLITTDLCTRVLNELEFAYWRRSTVIDDANGVSVSPARTSETAFPDTFTAQLTCAVREVEEAVLTATSIPARSLAGWQALRYGVGARFDEHHDDPYGVLGRIRSIMVVLRGPESGGELEFPDADLVVQPVAGTVVSWVNRWPDGIGSRLGIHRVHPVLRGQRVSLVSWSSHPILQSHTQNHRDGDEHECT